MFGVVDMQDGNIEGTADFAKDLENYNKPEETEKVMMTDDSGSHGQRSRNRRGSRVFCGSCRVKERHRLSLGTWESAVELVGLFLG